MNNLFEREDEITRIVLYQLKRFWFDIDESVIQEAIPSALKIIKDSFSGLSSPRFFQEGEAQFSPYMSVHWMLFLFRLSHQIYINGRENSQTPKEADMVYYLNKILHSVDWYYAIDLPIHFLCEHPLGSVLGRAKYGDRLFVYQGTTIGGNHRKDLIDYPTIGDNVILYANSTILGGCNIGNNVVISSDSYLINEVIPDNSLVFGRSPNLIIKQKSEEEIKSYTEHIWGWKL